MKRFMHIHERCLVLTYVENIDSQHLAIRWLAATCLFSLLILNCIPASAGEDSKSAQPEYADVWVRENSSGHPYQVSEWLENGKSVAYDKKDILFGTFVNERSREFQGAFFFSGKRIRSNKFRATEKEQKNVVWDKFKVTLSRGQQLTLIRLSPWHPSLVPPEYGALRAALNEKYGGEIIATSSEGYLIRTNVYDAFTNVVGSSSSGYCSYNGGTYGIPYGLAYKLKNGQTVWEKFILIKSKHTVDFNESPSGREALSEATFHYTSAQNAYVLPDKNTLLAVPNVIYSSVVRLKLTTGEIDTPHPNVRVIDAVQVRSVIKALFDSGVIQTQPLPENERFGSYTLRIAYDEDNWCAAVVDQTIYKHFFLETE